MALLLVIFKIRTKITLLAVSNIYLTLFKYRAWSGSERHSSLNLSASEAEKSVTFLSTTKHASRLRLRNRSKSPRSRDVNPGKAWQIE